MSVMQSPIVRARFILGSRYRQTDRGEIFLDGKRSCLRDVMRAANDALRDANLPAINYPSVNPIDCGRS